MRVCPPLSVSVVRHYDPASRVLVEPLPRLWCERRTLLLLARVYLSLMLFREGAHQLCCVRVRVRVRACACACACVHVRVRAHGPIRILFKL